MNLTISPPIRILALVGLLAVVALGASTVLLGHSSAPTHTSTAKPLSGRSVTGAAPKTTTPAQTAAKPALKTTTHTKTKTHTKTQAKTPTAALTGAKTHAKTQAKKATATRVRHVPHGNLVYADLPKPLQQQLARHKVVVVSLYNPDADVDAISVAEAHAGTLDAGAGFLLVSVLDNAVAGPLTALLPGGGLLPDPGVFVYRAPGDIMVRLDGFADRTTVAQAATNALLGPAPAHKAAATVTTPATIGAAPGTPVSP